MKLYYAPGTEWKRSAKEAVWSVVWGAIAIAVFIWLNESIVVQVLCLSVVIWQAANVLRMPDRVYIEIDPGTISIHHGYPFMRKKVRVQDITRAGLFNDSLCLYNGKGKEIVVYLNRLSARDQSTLLNLLKKNNAQVFEEMVTNNRR